MLYSTYFDQFNTNFHAFEQILRKYFNFENFKKFEAKFTKQKHVF